VHVNTANPVFDHIEIRLEPLSCQVIQVTVPVDVDVFALGVIQHLFDFGDKIGALTVYADPDIHAVILGEFTAFGQSFADLLQGLFFGYPLVD